MEANPLAGQGSAAKRHRQSEQARDRNRSIRGKVRTGIRKFLVQVDANSKETASQQLQVVTKLIDTAASKGVYHQNTAARTKSRLNKKLNAIE
ncbi:MAG: 30S ribosomal protein S20 [Spirochaetales bacterium]|nr:MAG: 30S ribosomal protein S20 [Spirochaetales bacterium]